MGVFRVHHDIEDLFLVHGLPWNLRVRVLLRVVDGEGMRLGHGRGVPCGLMRGIGVEGCGISPGVHG